MHVTFDFDGHVDGIQLVAAASRPVVHIPAIIMAVFLFSFGTACDKIFHFRFCALVRECIAIRPLGLYRDIMLFNSCFAYRGRQKSASQVW